MIRVVIPYHLRTLARVESKVELPAEEAATIGGVLDALEARFPALRGTLRDHTTRQRRPFIRFFACKEDLSHESETCPLPPSVLSGEEPFLIIGAMAGG